MTTQIKIHYAVQVCDTASYQGSKRFCGDDRTLLSKKSLTSLLNSIKNTTDTHSNVLHEILIIYDNTSNDLLSYIEKLVEKFQSQCIHIELQSLKPRTGIVDSIRYCYQWLDEHGQDLVFQIQDDYLFSIPTITDCLDHFYLTVNELNTHPVIQPFNDITYWAFGYKNRPTPRLISLGKNGYWIQIYDTSCSFMTSHWQFRQHWDLYDRFFHLIPNLGKKDSKLENDSLNYIFTKRAVLGLTPINTLSHHIQTQPDLYIDWRPLWDSIAVDHD